NLDTGRVPAISQVLCIRGRDRSAHSPKLQFETPGIHPVRMLPAGRIFFNLLSPAFAAGFRADPEATQIESRTRSRAHHILSVLLYSLGPICQGWPTWRGNRRFPDRATCRYGHPWSRTRAGTPC